jgi:hypothetical protein
VRAEYIRSDTLSLDPITPSMSWPPEPGQASPGLAGGPGFVQMLSPKLYEVKNIQCWWTRDIVHELTVDIRGAVTFMWCAWDVFLGEVRMGKWTETQETDTYTTCTPPLLITAGAFETDWYMRVKPEHQALCQEPK